MVTESERKSRSFEKNMSSKVRESRTKTSRTVETMAMKDFDEEDEETDLEDALSEEAEDDGSDWGPSWSEVKTSDLDFTTDDDQDDGIDKDRKKKKTSSSKQRQNVSNRSPHSIYAYSCYQCFLVPTE